MKVRAAVIGLLLNVFVILTPGEGPLAAVPTAQWYETVVDPTKSFSSLCWADMEKDGTGAPIIAFLREGSCPGPYVAAWSTDHWTVQSLLPQCLPNFSCHSGGNIPIDIAVDHADKAHVIFGTDGEGIQYFHQGDQGWEMETVSTGAFPVALAVDKNAAPVVAMVSPQFDITATGQDHYIAKKIDGHWNLTSIGNYEETHFHRLAMGSAGETYLSFQRGVTLTLLKSVTGPFQTIFAKGGELNTPLPFVLGSQDQVHLALVKHEDGARVAAYGTSPSYGLLMLPRNDYPGGLDIDLSAAGDPRLVYENAPFLAYGEWNGATFSTETVQFGAWRLSFQFRQPLRLEMGIGDHPYILGFDYPEDDLGYYLKLTAKLPPPATMTLSTKTVSSIGWSWPAAPSAIVTGYRVRSGLDNADLSGILPSTSLGWTLNGTSANSEISAKLETIYPGFVISSTPVVATSLPLPPRQLELSRAGAGPLSANWSANGNAAGTSYRVEFHGADGTTLSETVPAPNVVYPLLNARVPYGMTVVTLGREGEQCRLSTVESVMTGTDGTRMTFSMDGLTIGVRLFPTEGFPFPVGAASPRSDFSALDDPGWVGTNRGFHLSMDSPLPASQGGAITVDFPAEWLDAAPAGQKVLARYNPTHHSWVPLPTSQEGRRLTARVDGWGEFQVLVRPENGAAKTVRAAYPNPFRPMGGIPMVVRDVPSGVRARVSSLDGRSVRTLVGNPSGLVEWDGRDEEGSVVKSGVYLISFEDQGDKTNIKVIVER